MQIQQQVLEFIHRPLRWGPGGLRSWSPPRPAPSARRPGGPLRASGPDAPGRDVAPSEAWPGLGGGRCPEERGSPATDLGPFPALAGAQGPQRERPGRRGERSEAGAMATPARTARSPRHPRVCRCLGGGAPLRGC